MEEFAGRGCRPFIGGVEDGRSSGVGLAPLLLGCMSPVAVLSLFVKDEMAQPNTCPPTPGCGVLILVFGADAASGGGSTVSGRVVLYFRTRSK